MRITKAMRQIEVREGLPIRELLKNLFKQYGTQTRVAEKLGIDQSTLSDWLLKLDLEQRTVLVEREAQR